MRSAFGISMRYFLPIALLGIAVSGPAGASSFVMLERAVDAATPSIIFYREPRVETLAPSSPDVVMQPPIPLGAPPPGLAGGAGDMAVISPSIIALGEPAVETGQVASIGQRERPRQRGPNLPPMVIRGGIFGDPFGGPSEATSSAPLEAAAPPGSMEPAASPRPSASPMPSSPATGARPPRQRSGPDRPGGADRPW